MMAKFGSWAFIVGLIIAVLAGVVIPPAAWLMLILAALGIVVGVLNVTAKESTPFLVAVIALVVSTDTINRLLDAASLSGAIATTIQTVMGNVAIFVAPAAVIVAIRAIFALAAEE